MQRATFTISDISWRKQAELELLKKEKLQAVVEMAGAVCHEMNQPMQVALVQLAECLVMDEFESGPVKQKAENIRQQLNSLREMSRKLMHITKYETRDYVKGEKIIDIDKSSGTVP
jgi:predicted Ser/Thr protein kinase